MTPEQNTKIERVIEGMESLTNAVVELQSAPKGRRAKAFNAVQEARSELRKGLVEFLKPALRVVENIRKAS
jgi:hypothetical protein